MHPIEHLRYVARATGADPAVVAQEAASAMAEMVRMQPAGLLPACRRLIERHLTAGPIWWLSARMLSADDPARAGRDAAIELDEDPTSARVGDCLADGATALLIGWPDICSEALRGRGDIEVLVVSSGGEGDQFARRLRDRDVEVSLVPDSGVGPAAAVVDVVLIEATAAGPGGVLAAPGSVAAAAVASHQQIPVWAVAGVGRVLPGRLWDSLVSRLDESGDEPWDRPVELVPASLLSHVVGPEGIAEVGPGLANTTCQAMPELFRAAG
jgi:hypothetical protein